MHIHKKTFSKIGHLATFSFVFLLLPILVFGAGEAFVPLTDGGIPGVSSGVEFKDFLNAVFKLGLAIAVTLAVIMITVGGLEYMTTDSVNNKSSGKEKIQNALMGLLIALMIWIILFTINPNLLNIDLKIGTGSGAPTDYELEDYSSIPTTNLRGGNVLDYEGDAYP
ncbi:MAG: pilin [Candidatus Paceibacterota bacterium]